MLTFAGRPSGASGSHPSSSPRGNPHPGNSHCVLLPLRVPSITFHPRRTARPHHSVLGRCKSRPAQCDLGILRLRPLRLPLTTLHFLATSRALRGLAPPLWCGVQSVRRTSPTAPASSFPGCTWHRPGTCFPPPFLAAPLCPCRLLLLAAITDA